MKKMLYAGAALMIGASVYGFVDYKRTSQKKEFKSMYVEDKKDPAPVVVDKDAVVIEKTDLNKTVKTVKEEKKVNNQVKDEVKKSGTRRFRLREFSRGRIPDDVEEAGVGKIMTVDSATVIHK